MLNGENECFRKTLPPYASLAKVKSFSPKTSSMPEATQIHNLSVGFKTADKTITAVDNISFTLNPGKTLALLGESGCGKSLTSLALMRLLPNNAVYGEASKIHFANQDLLELPESVMRCFRGRRLAMIFQEPMTALNPVLSIGQQLAEAITEHQPLRPPQLNERMVDLLKEVEIPQPELRLNQYPHQLSGGQKQRIVIAMALASNPDVLIADEPTTALDVTIQAQILGLLKKLQVLYQMSILFITHDLGVVKAIADNVCVMYAGQIVETAPVEKFFKQPLHPYAQQLFVSLPSINTRGQRLQTLTGVVPTLDALPSGCRFHPRCAHRFSPCSTIEPPLQTAKKERVVRCHLYPEHKKLPPLTMSRQLWDTSATESEVILTVNDLAVYFNSSQGLLKRKKTICKAVDGLSFTLHKGKTIALVGESGCGKTTVSRALLRLQPITAGEIRFAGQDITTLQGRALRNFRKKVQIIFQDPYSSMNPRMTVDEILAEGLQAQGLNAAKIRARQYELLDHVNLAKNSLQRYPHQFSGGQRQRICIARALATEPELLICDEPTSALDMSVQAQILNLLKSLQQQFSLSYVFITHNMAVVSYLADDVLVMQQGKVVELGRCEELFKHPKQPYTKQLLASVLTI
jgi:peptide/nickel transport system ATP-binding protein